LIEAQRSSRRDAGLYGAPIVAAIALTKLRRIDEARNALIEARRIRPALNLAEIEKFFSQNAASDLKSIWNGGKPARG
jgi:hypothetical protein